MDRASKSSGAMSIREIALDLTVFTLSNVNDAISFKPQLCFEVPRQDYQTLKDNYISFTGTSIRKNRSKLFFLPTNVSDELQKLNPSIPDDAKHVPCDGRVYYKNRLITELDYENVKRVETACAFIAYTALNSFAHFETEPPHSQARAGDDSNDDESEDEVSAAESVARALRKGNILGFRELGHLVGITPWHFHRVFKVITGLTIREYGQLCVEFIKKNKEIVNTCRVKVEQIKLEQRFSCLDDPAFLQDGSLQYAATENVVLLHEYFIDPNKSRELKTRKNGASAKKQLSVKKEPEGPKGPPATQRSEIRKRRSSVMYGRMQRASQSSITSSSSLYECLQNSHSGTNLRSPDYYLSNEEQHSDNESDDSTGSGFNLFPVATAKSVSPPVTSRKGSIISIGSAGGVGKKAGKRKSITAVNIDAMQSSMLHRRNRSDGCPINLSFEPLSLDARLSPQPVQPPGSQFPIEFNSSMFDAKTATKIVDSANGGVLSNENKVDFSIGPLDYNVINEELLSTTGFTTTTSKMLHQKGAVPSMTDVSLFNNSLLEETTPAEASALNLSLENIPQATTTTGSSTSYAPDEEQGVSRSAPSMDDILDSANPLDTNLVGMLNMAPLGECNAKGREPDLDSFFNPLPADEDEDLLLDTRFPAADDLVLADSGLIAPGSVAAPAAYAAVNNTNIDAFNF